MNTQNQNTDKYNQIIDILHIREFNDLGHIRLALTHRSFSRNNNERLEYLGDAVLELVITEFLFRDFPDKPEGELTSLRAALVKSESLAFESNRLGLNKYIRMSRSEEATGGRDKQYILADVFEAVIGAIHIDQGYEKAKKFIKENLYYKIQAIIQSGQAVDAKSKLQEIAQEKFKETPFYKVIKEEGPDHEKVFTVICVIGRKKYAEGEGKSKQAAEQQSAIKTLEKISI